MNAGPLSMVAARRERVLNLADSNLILSQQLMAWCGHAPMIEEDLGLANVALDLLGQARLWYALVCASEPAFGDENQLAMRRDVPQWRNMLLVEAPNGDFADTMMRQALYDQYHWLLLQGLAQSSDRAVQEIAAKAVKEVSYHRVRSGDWVVRLGDGTQESHRRCQRALDRLWPYVGELLVDYPADLLLAQEQVAPMPSQLAAPFEAGVAELCRQATLQMPAFTEPRRGGREAYHTEALGYVLAEMQFLDRTYPGATW